MARFKVKCTFFVEVDLDDLPAGTTPKFVIEENGCPGTGVVGRALEEVQRKCDENSTCWACALGGTNEIVEKG